MIIRSETYDGMLHDNGTPEDRRLLSVGLGDEAVEFARNTAAKRASVDVIPIAADIMVRTVQLGGEPIEQTMNRAIRSEELIPVYLWPFSSIMEELLFDYIWPCISRGTVFREEKV